MRKNFDKFKKIFLLSFSLAKINFKLRNEGSYLGVFWYLLNPLVLFLVIILVNEVSFWNKEIQFYPVYLLIGIICFNFLKQVISTSLQVMDLNREFVKSLNSVEIEVFVFATVLENFFSHLFELLLLGVLVLYFGLSPVGLLLYFLGLLFFLPFITGVSLLSASLGVFIKDLNNIWLVLSQIIFFVTPIFYQLSYNSAVYFLNIFNPLFYYITISRNIIIYQKFSPLWMIGLILVFGFLILVAGWKLFQTKKYKFAEEM